MVQLSLNAAVRHYHGSVSFYEFRITWAHFEQNWNIYSIVRRRSMLPRATTVVASASMTYVRKFSVKETLTAELSEG